MKRQQFSAEETFLFLWKHRTDPEGWRVLGSRELRIFLGRSQEIQDFLTSVECFILDGDDILHYRRVKAGMQRKSKKELLKLIQGLCSEEGKWTPRLGHGDARVIDIRTRLALARVAFEEKRKAA